MRAPSNWAAPPAELLCGALPQAPLKELRPLRIPISAFQEGRYWAPLRVATLGVCLRRRRTAPAFLKPNVSGIPKGQVPLWQGLWGRRPHMVFRHDHLRGIVTGQVAAPGGEGGVAGAEHEDGGGAIRACRDELGGLFLVREVQDLQAGRPVAVGDLM